MTFLRRKEFPTGGSLEKKRLRRWGRWVFFTSLAALGLLIVAWRVAIYIAEKTTPFAGNPLPTCGQTAGERYADAIEKVRGQIQAMMAERQIPGLSATIAEDGRIVCSEGFGYADRENKLRACPQTRFRIGSVAKLFAVAAMAQLYEQGRLDLDAPIQQYALGFPDKGYRITARHLASHRAGIRGYRDDYEAMNAKPYANISESLEKFRDDPLMFRPDSDFAYSNYGYVLLSAAIEGASGEDFLSYLRRNVFEPLRMHDTVEIRASHAAPNQSRFYDNVTPFSPDGQIRESPSIDFSSKWASGGFLSTAEDLARFGSAHIAPVNQTFLKADTLELLFTPRTKRGWIVGYGHGLGWMTARDLHLRQAHFHFGASSGGTSVLAIYPARKLSIALAANLGHAKFPFERLMGIVNPFLDAAN